MGSGYSKEYDSDLDFWGAPDDYRQEKPSDLGIYPENWDIVGLFVRLQTQWRLSPTGHRVGLDYQSIPVVCEAMGLEFSEVFPGVQVMEIAAINEIAKHGNR